MSSVSRRAFIASAAATAAAQTASDVRGVKAPPQQHLLSGPWPAAKLQAVLLAPGKWHPFPDHTERTKWDAIPPALRQAAVASAEKKLGAPWPSLTATLFLQFVRDGNRSNYEDVSFGRRDRVRELVVAECIEGKGRFRDDIANGLWLICEETYWGVAAHVGIQKRGAGLPDVTEPTIDLFAAETGELLVWTSYLLGAALDEVHPLVRERIAIEVERRLLAPYRARKDFWWMGLEADRPVNNWNPWINSNCLACALLLERDPAQRAALVHKILTSLDRFLDSYHPDGGCDEGPGYWARAGGSLFDNLELLYSASGGAIDFYQMPLVGEIGRYIYRAHIHDRWFVNFADASAKEDIPGELVYRYGKRIGDERLRQFGAWAAQSQGLTAVLEPGSIGRELLALFDTEVSSAPARQPLVRDTWLPGVQIMAARMRDGSAEGLYLAAQGGHNAESHNHNDVGNFIVYADGEPAIIDVGVETYTAKTFSAQRYDIWTMQSAFHNLPTVNGVMQGAGREFAARDVTYKSDDAAVEFGLDIAAAYPAEAGIERWTRTLRLDRKRGEVEVRDAWKLRTAGKIAFTLMTPSEVAQERGILRLSGGQLKRAVEVRFDPQLLTPAVERIPIGDPRLKGAWGPVLYRILLKSAEAPAAGEAILHIR